ncbi:MAG: aminomethyl transferase family protein [Proteobacteria bacterium]|nr:aminomethyl transferase family protein [Pseudomonadota bacterium]
MKGEDQARALRHSVALSSLTHVSCMRLAGVGASDAVTRLCPAELFLRDGQMLHTLFLDDNAHVVADVYLCRDNADFYLLVEGLSGDQLEQYIRGALPPGAQVTLDDMSAEHEILSINGPYAWEALSKALNPEIVSLPYMSFYNMEGYTCFRAGKTGEFGYDLMVPADDAERIRSRLLELKHVFDMETADLEALDQCALENFFFNIRREGRAKVTPIELQLQWRVSYSKDFVGASALKDHKQAGVKTRLTCLLADSSIQIGDEMCHEDRVIGTIVNAGWSGVRGDFVGMALIEVDLAYPGLKCFTAGVGDGAVPVRTVSPPVIDNRSLFVNPQLHTYKTRDDFDFPPLC